MSNVKTATKTKFIIIFVMKNDQLFVCRYSALLSAPDLLEQGTVYDFFVNMKIDSGKVEKSLG